MLNGSASCCSMYLDQLPTLIRRQPALQWQTVAQADLGEHGMIEQFIGQAAGEQALARFGPVEF
jgi:hypothetical protein